jgi:uncharacterized protein YkwD
MEKILCLFLTLILLTSCSGTRDIFPENKESNTKIVTEKVTDVEISTEIPNTSTAETTAQSSTSNTKIVTKKVTTTTRFPAFPSAKSTTSAVTTKNLTTTSTKTTSVTTTTTSVTTTEKTTSTTKKTVTTTTENLTTTDENPVTEPNSDDFATEVVRLVNIERRNEGLSSLSIATTLAAAAKTRAYEIMDVFEHTRPDGSSCFTVFDDFRISYSYAGENIAAGQHSPQEVVTAWMNSPGHRKNILDSNFKHIGIGYVHDSSSPYKDYWAQLFTD